MTNLFGDDYDLTQKERLEKAYKLVSSVWQELAADNIQLAQPNMNIAVSLQIDINRIVWKLNEHYFERRSNL